MFTIQSLDDIVHRRYPANGRFQSILQRKWPEKKHVAAGCPKPLALGPSRHLALRAQIPLKWAVGSLDAILPGIISQRTDAALSAYSTL